MQKKHFGFIGFGLIGGSIARALKAFVKETPVLTAFQYGDNPSRSLTLAKEAGNQKAVNVVLIGVMAKKTDIAYEKWIETIKTTVPVYKLNRADKTFETVSIEDIQYKNFYTNTKGNELVVRTTRGDTMEVFIYEN